MSEDFRRVNTYLNIHKMFPRAAKIVEILGWLQQYWPEIVGTNVAAFSRPYKLGFEELCVSVDGDKPFAKKRLISMKGNILKIMCERFGYEKGEKFVLTLTEQVPVRVMPAAKKKLPVQIQVSEEKVQEYMKGAPETLPEDINHAISHLRVFLEELRRMV